MDLKASGVLGLRPRGSNPRSPLMKSSFISATARKVLSRSAVSAGVSHVLVMPYASMAPTRPMMKAAKPKPVS